MSKQEKLIHWSIFNVSIALLPLLFNLMFLFIQEKFPGFNILLYRGELLIISAAISADALGEYVNGTITNKTAKLIIGGSCVLLLAMSSLLFAAIAINAEQLNQNRVAIISVSVFLATILTSGICKYLSVNP